MVTRHVRQDAGAPTTTALPARPELARQDSLPVVAGKPVKLRVSQLQARDMSGSWTSGLAHSPELRPLRTEFSYSFTASEAQAYDVASVCARDGDAALLLSIGVKDAGEARALLSSLGFDHLLADRSELMQAALAKCIRYEDALSHWAIMSADQPVENRIGAIKLATSPVHTVYGVEKIVDQVLEGGIDFEDIRAARLHTRRSDMLLHFASLLERTRAGEEGYSVQAVRALVDRIGAEKATPFEAENLAALARLVGVDAVVDLPSLSSASEAQRSMKLSGALDQPNAGELALYAARFFASEGWEWFAARDFYRAGVPVETAIKVHASGGTAEQAAAVERGDVTAPLSGGYL